MRVPWDNWDSYEAGLAEHPIITKTAINVVIYLLGDWLSQVPRNPTPRTQFCHFGVCLASRRSNARRGVITAGTGVKTVRLTGISIVATSYVQE